MPSNKIKNKFNRSVTSATATTFDGYANISSLHATQMRVGYIEIEKKRRDLVDKASKGKLRAYLEANPVMVVLWDLLASRIPGPSRP